MSAPVSQMSAAALPAGTEQLALVAALVQRADDARTPGPGMPAVLLEDEGEVLPDELRTRDAAFAGSTGEQPIIFRIQRDGGRLLPGKCRESNMTRAGRTVKRNTPVRGDGRVARVSSCMVKGLGDVPLAAEPGTVWR
jgi:hypothetical protein